MILLYSRDFKITGLCNKRWIVAVDNNTLDIYNTRWDISHTHFGGRNSVCSNKKERIWKEDFAILYIYQKWWVNLLRAVWVPKRNKKKKVSSIFTSYCLVQPRTVRTEIRPHYLLRTVWVIDSSQLYFVLSHATPDGTYKSVRPFILFCPFYIYFVRSGFSPILFWPSRTCPDFPYLQNSRERHNGK